MDMIPLILVTGFLDAGKTTFIQSILEDPQFLAGEKVIEVGVIVWVNIVFVFDAFVCVVEFGWFVARLLGCVRRGRRGVCRCRGSSRAF